ncbi:dihydropteroate synthase [Psychroflexus sp. ALD_RP9]|uniref:dihydropteroate synthase n=1 Tax=Psychroflexus sp. ALD_RP9 TaxID=2777186 RepID=UPI001A8D140B|nr:dihydropteroate synthase [Psychroflexus sp. ALD_RP9]QSS97249.1 dihydropteroate synthase [Psychroflexus sp. ALD_RP9]
MTSINCKGELIDLSKPKVMGILNLTPDSFYDGGKFKNEIQVIKQVKKMLIEGATFVDLGAYSSKPGAVDISVEEELNRLIPVLKLLRKEFPEVIFSIDTFRSQVADAALNEGAAIINDISGGNLDLKMYEVVAKYQVPYVMMHMKGTPQNMKSLATYDDLLIEMRHYFSANVAKAQNAGIHDIILDPGFGFAKDIDQNFELLSKLELLQIQGLPLLVGLSRKSMIYKVLNISAKEALNGTTALNMIALQKGAKILRVHDVKEAKETIDLYNRLTSLDEV